MCTQCHIPTIRKHFYYMKISYNQMTTTATIIHKISSFVDGDYSVYSTWSMIMTNKQLDFLTLIMWLRDNQKINPTDLKLNPLDQKHSQLCHSDSQFLDSLQSNFCTNLIFIAKFLIFIFQMLMITLECLFYSYKFSSPCRSISNISFENLKKI